MLIKLKLGLILKELNGNYWKCGVKMDVIIGVPYIHIRNCFYIETDVSRIGKILVYRIINPKYQQFIHKKTTFSLFKARVYIILLYT